MSRPGFVLEVDDRTPPLVVHEGEGFRLETFPRGTRVVYPAESLPSLRDVDGAIRQALLQPTNSEPLPALLRAGVPVGIGTDGAVSAGALDMFAGIRMAALLHKGTTRDPRTVGAEAAVRLATAGGAAVLGLGDRVGSLTVGRRADLIVCDLDRPHVAPNPDPWSAVAYGLTAADVRHTVVEGRVLMHDRVLTTIDQRSVVDRVGALCGARAAGEERA